MNLRRQMTGRHAPYRYVAGQFDVTPEVKADFEAKGYIIVRNLLNDEELSKIRGVLENSEVIERNALNLANGTERHSRMCLWNQPGSDVTGMMARCEKVAGNCEKLLGGEVYHYHTKLMMKEAQTGGRFVWHQDYGYWYNNACLFPDMMTVFVAMDPSHQDNGCLQVLEGSHRCGRIEHSRVGGQMGADMERVEMLKKRCPLVHVEMEPGDALFFHCNLLHASSANNSPNRRWALLCAFNRASNNPMKEHVHPLYTKLHKVPDTAILQCTLDWDTESNKAFLNQTKRDDYWEKVHKRPEVA